MEYEQGSPEWAARLGIEPITAKALRDAKEHGDNVDYDMFEAILSKRDPQHRFGRRKK